MNRATPQMRDLSQRLIGYETMGNKSKKEETAGVFHACEKLRPSLAALMGGMGFTALLARALAVASVEDPSLRAVEVKPNGSLARLSEVANPANREQILEGGVVLLAHLLGLLVAFIGEKLTLQMVRDVWPKLSLPNLDSKESKNK